MRKISSYWLRVFKRAMRGASSFANDWQWVYGTPPLAFLLWVANRWFGSGTVTLSEGWLGGFEAAAAAFVLTWVARFIARLVKVPADMDHELRCSITAKNQEIHNALSIKETVPRLIELQENGRSIYFRKFDTKNDSACHEWTRDLEGWQERVERELEEHWSESELFKFKSATWCIGMYRRNYESEEEWTAKNFDALRLYTAKIGALTPIIEFGPSRLVGSRMALQKALEAGGSGAVDGEISNVQRKIP